MITCVQKDTHTKKIDRPNRIGKFVPRMSNKTKFVNCVGCNSKCYFNSETKPEFFSDIIVILWSTLFRREITRVPKRTEFPPH